MENEKLPQRFVLINGFLRSKFHWGKLPDLLKSDLGAKNIDLMELPGNGYAHLDRTPDSIDEVIQIFRKQVSEKGLPSVIIGQCLGGAIATRWAQLYPKEISHLIVLNTSSNLSPLYKRISPMLYTGIIKNMVLSEPIGFEKFFLTAASNNKDNWLPLLGEYADFLKNHPIALTNFIRQLKLSVAVNFKEVPIFHKLILCSFNDKFTSYECSDTIARDWGGVAERNNTAGHDLALDDPKWIISILRKYYC